MGKRTNMKTLTLIVVLFLLSGCSILGGVADRAGEVNDEALNAAEFTICHGASIGSIRRHYGSPEKSRIWTELCNSVDAFNLNKN